MKDYSFGNYICALRVGHGLSQFQLGNLVGVSDKAVSKWENGDAKPRISTCYRLAEVLGVSINELLSCEKRTSIPTRRELDKMNDKLWNEAFERLSIYGKEPPAICLSRLTAEKLALYETDAVQSFAVLGELTRATAKDGMTFFAAETVASSFAAWLLGATKVNPLPPHYRCPKCGNTEFVSDVADGFDLPAKMCACGEELIRDGHNIPFEGYAKSEHRRTAVDIRVSTKVKPIAIEVIRKCYKDKAEILPVKLVFDDGHPSAIEKYVVMDGRRDKPALSEDGYWHAGSEEFWRWLDRETTFSIICSYQPCQIQMLQELTKTNCPDPLMLATPQIAEKLYQRERKRNEYVASMMDKLGEDQPHDFHIMMKVSGFSHGSGVWSTYQYDGKLLCINGEKLIQEGRAASFRDIPAFREDVWHDISFALARNGILDNGLALQMMEDVRLGRYYNDGMPKELEKMILSLGLPEWYPEFLKKVMYIFPKGHCVSLLLFDMILEWYADNYPEEYKQMESIIAS